VSHELTLLDEGQLKDIAQEALSEYAKRRKIIYGLLSITVKIQDGKVVHYEQETKEVGRY